MENFVSIDGGRRDQDSQINEQSIQCKHILPGETRGHRLNMVVACYGYNANQPRAICL